jgi:drug/metabolite transporter (DMT)-like permease
MQFILVILGLAVIRGLLVTSQKTVQKDFANDLPQVMYLTMMMALFQFVLLWAMPPYQRFTIVETTQLIYPAVFGLLMIGVTVFFFTSFRLGSTALSTIVNNFSMLVPIMFGLVFWGEIITGYQIFGIGLVLLALVFFTAKEKEDKKASLKWLSVAIAGTLFTGCAILISKQNSLSYPEYFKEYLLLLNFVNFLACVPYVLWAAAKKKIKLIPDKRYVLLVTIIAVLNNVYNLIFMVVVGEYDSALFFPVSGVTGTIAVVLCSWMILKEKLPRRAYIGIVLSIIAIALLSL